MSYEVHLRVYDRAGTVKIPFLAPLWARWRKSVTAASPLTFALNEDTAGANEIGEYDIIEVMLRNKELGIMIGSNQFARAFVGIVRSRRQDTSNNNVTTKIFNAPEQKHILDWRGIMYASGVANRSTYSNLPAETIMKSVVRYNFTADATHTPGDATSRVRNGDLAIGMQSPITIAADEGRGTTQSASFAFGRVLGVLQRLAAVSGGDFLFEWQGGSLGGDHEYLFDFRPGQLGSDKSDRAVFGLENQTLQQARRQRFGAEGTVAIVGGRNQGIEREISVAEGEAFAAANDIEVFVPATDVSTENGRLSRGQERLREIGELDELEFEVRQTADTFYSPVDVNGRNTYDVGDLVTVSYGGTEVHKVVAATLSWQAPGTGDLLQIQVDTEKYVNVA